MHESGGAHIVVSLPCTDCRLSGKERTLRGHAVLVVIDPEQTWCLIGRPMPSNYHFAFVYLLILTVQ